MPAYKIIAIYTFNHKHIIHYIYNSTEKQFMEKKNCFLVELLKNMNKFVQRKSLISINQTIYIMT